MHLADYEENGSLRHAMEKRFNLFLIYTQFPNRYKLEKVIKLNI